MAEAFRTGGMWMYFILMACIVGWSLAVIGLVAAFVSKRSAVGIVLGAIVIVIGLGTAGVGGIGYAVGMSQMEAALGHASPENRETLRRKGEEYATYPLYFGLGGGAVPVLLGLLTVGAGVMRRGES